MTQPPATTCGRCGGSDHAPEQCPQYPFDTEIAPVVEFRRSPGELPGGGVRSGWGAPAGSQAIADFAANPAAAEPFCRWLQSNEAWAAFGDWYDSGGAR